MEILQNYRRFIIHILKLYFKREKPPGRMAFFIITIKLNQKHLKTLFYDSTNLIIINLNTKYLTYNL